MKCDSHLLEGELREVLMSQSSANFGLLFQGPKFAVLIVMNFEILQEKVLDHSG